MYCVKCGEKLSEGTKFCNFCGAPVPIRKARKDVDGGIINQVGSESTGSRSSAIIPRGVDGRKAPLAPSQEWRRSTKPELGGPARAIMTNRGLLKWLLLSLITLGLYNYYFIYKMAQDMNTMCEDDDQNTGGLIAFLLLSLFTFGIYGVYWWYKIGNRVYVNAPRYGLAVAEQGSTFLLWYLLGLLTFGIAALVGYHVVIKNVNALAKAYNHAKGFM